MSEQSKNYIFSYDEVRTVCETLGVSISLNEFKQNMSAYIRLKKNYDIAIDSYVSRNAESLLMFSQKLSKEKNIPLPQAVGEARIYFRQQALSLLEKKQISVIIPEKIKKIETEQKEIIDFSSSQLCEKMKNWKNHHNEQLLLDAPAKEMLRHSNFAELDILLKDLGIKKSNYALFKMNLSRYKGSLTKFLADFEQKKLPYFQHLQPQKNSSDFTPSVQPLNVAPAVTPSVQPLNVAPAVTPSIQPLNVAPAVTPSIQPLNVAPAVTPSVLPSDVEPAVTPSVQPSDVEPAVTPSHSLTADNTASQQKQKFCYHFPSFTLSQKSLFNWRKSIKKCYKVCSVHFRKLNESLPKVSLPKAKTIYLKPNFYTYGKKALKYAAITIPFLTLEFLGYRQACKAADVKITPKIENVADNFDFGHIKKQISDAFSSYMTTDSTSLSHQKNDLRSDIENLTQKFKDRNILSNNCLLNMKPLEFSSARISSPYGYRTHPISGQYRLHTGIDYAAPSGSCIYASADGVVQRAEWAGGYGRYVVIKHDNEYSTAYAHMSRFVRGLRPGTKVKKGDIIGYVGSTGNATGPHLHFEVIKHGQKVNPLSLGTVRVLASR